MYAMLYLYITFYNLHMYAVVSIYLHSTIYVCTVCCIYLSMRTSENKWWTWIYIIIFPNPSTIFLSINYISIDLNPVYSTHAVYLSIYLSIYLCIPKLSWLGATRVSFRHLGNHFSGLVIYRHIQAFTGIYRDIQAYTGI